MFTRSLRGRFSYASKWPCVCRNRLTEGGRRRAPRAQTVVRSLSTSQSSSPPPNETPFRKILKDAAKQQRNENASKALPSLSIKKQDGRLDKWELTVGIEVHAELNTARKLFSSAATSVGEAPNTHVALFDAAFPGSQPIFQKETLIPAIRAALAFDCEIQQQSSFDRKHYFYQDQPAGYQITQFYQPFARNGRLVLYSHDFPAGTAPQSEPFLIGIKQIQMEQDTAKTIQQPPSTHLLDFNRVSHPLIEIITLPQIHHPLVAAVTVRKIQNILKSVNACTTGMEMGGLRADVNVSVRDRERGASDSGASYYGITGLGQRTEIKNLASVKAVEDAIIAERDRQIAVLEKGDIVESETRSWALGSKTTSRLRGKEGEIDYRYMPDPDIPPVVIGQDLVEHLRRTLPAIPDATVKLLVDEYGLSTKDALTLISLDGGDRLEYFFHVTAVARKEIMDLGEGNEITTQALGKVVGNWVLMEFGGLIRDEPFDYRRVPAAFLAATIVRIRRKRITSRSARRLVAMRFQGDSRSVQKMIEQENLVLKPMTRAEYLALAQELLDEKPDIVQAIREKGQERKIKWFVGQMISRSPDGIVEPEVAEATLKELLGIDEPQW